MTPAASRWYPSRPLLQPTFVLPEGSASFAPDSKTPPRAVPAVNTCSAHRRRCRLWHSSPGRRRGQRPRESCGGASDLKRSRGLSRAAVQTLLHATLCGRSSLRYPPAAAPSALLSGTMQGGRQLSSAPPQPTRSHHPQHPCGRHRRSVEQRVRHSSHTRSLGRASRDIVRHSSGCRLTPRCSGPHPGFRPGAAAELIRR